MVRFIAFPSVNFFENWPGPNHIQFIVFHEATYTIAALQDGMLSIAAYPLHF